MNSSKLSKQKTNLFGIFFIILILYFCLIVLDWCIKVYVNMNKFKPLQEAEKIEKDYKNLFQLKPRKKENKDLAQCFLQVTLVKKKNIKPL